MTTTTPQTSDVIKAAYVLNRLYGKSWFPLDDLRYFFGKAGATVPSVCMSIVELEDAGLIEIHRDGLVITLQGVTEGEKLFYPEPEDDTPERDQVEVMTTLWTLHSISSFDGTLHSISSFDEPVTRADIVKRSGLPQAQAVGILSDLVYDNLVSAKGGNKYALTPQGRTWIEAKSATLFAKSKGIG